MMITIFVLYVLVFMMTINIKSKYKKCQSKNAQAIKLHTQIFFKL